MRPFAGRVFAFVCVVLAACGGDGKKRVSCSDGGARCPAGDVCLDGYCVATGEARVSASAEAVGADLPVFVIDADGNECEAMTCKDLPYGSRVILRASEAPPGFRFAGWSGSAACVSDALEVLIPNLTTDLHCFANYAARLRVTGNVAGVAGGVTASSDSPTASCDGGSCEVDADARVQLSTTQRWGERFVGWSGEGCGDGYSLELVVTARDRDITCTANFVARVSVAGRAMGVEALIEVSSDAPTAVCEPGSCLIDQGASATLHAPAVEGFRFGGWSGTDACTGSERALTLTDLTAPQLCIATYLARVHVSGRAAGAEPAPPVSALSTDLYAACSGASCETDVGGSATLLASSASGYRLTGWSGPMCNGETSAALMLSEINADLECVANYVRGIAVMGAVVGAPGDVSASSTSPGASCAGGSCVIDAGGNATLTAPSVAGYRFLGWDGDPGCESANTTIRFEQVAESRTCYARYATRFVVRGAAAPAAGGSVRATSPTPGASCSDASCVLDAGGEATLEAVPSAGYRFSGWSGGGACTGAATTVRLRDVAGNTTCQANFVARLTVTGVVAPPAAGRVVASSDFAASMCAGPTCVVDQGATVVLRAEPANGYRFSAWSGPNCAQGSDPLEAVLNEVSAPATCTANFELIPRYTISATVTPVNGGRVDASSTSSSAQCAGASCTVTEGGTVRLAATPATGFRFRSWSGCSTSSNQTLTFANVRTNASCQANFERVPVTVSGRANPANRGAVAASSSAPGATCAGASCTLAPGGSVTLTATANAGSRFVSWSNNCGAGSDRATTVSNVQSDLVCTANFQETVTVSGLADPATGGTIAARSSSEGASCTGASCTINPGGSVTLTATASPGFRFVRWTNCGGNSERATTVANVQADTSCSASFQATVVIAGVVSPTGGGTIAARSSSEGASCTGASCTVDAGSSVTLMATASPGFRFVSWSSNCGGIDAAATLPNVPANTTCTASFQAIATVSWAADPAAGGAVTAVSPPPDAICSGASCTVSQGSSLTLMANESAGFRFVNWSGLCVGTAPSATVSVQMDASCTANFELVGDAGALSATLPTGLRLVFSGAAAMDGGVP